MYCVFHGVTLDLAQNLSFLLLEFFLHRICITEYPSFNDVLKQFNFDYVQKIINQIEVKLTQYFLQMFNIYTFYSVAHIHLMFKSSYTLINSEVMEVISSSFPIKPVGIIIRSLQWFSSNLCYPCINAVYAEIRIWTSHLV